MMKLKLWNFIPMESNFDAIHKYMESGLAGETKTKLLDGTIKNIKDIKVILNYSGPLNAPIKKDQEIGELVIEVGETKKILPIYASEKVKKVIKPNNNVVANIIKIKMFLFMNSHIILKYINFI